MIYRVSQATPHRRLIARWLSKREAIKQANELHAKTGERYDVVQERLIHTAWKGMPQ